MSHPDEISGLALLCDRLGSEIGLKAWRVLATYAEEVTQRHACQNPHWTHVPALVFDTPEGEFTAIHGPRPGSRRSA